MSLAHGSGVEGGWQGGYVGPYGPGRVTEMFHSHTALIL